MNRCQTCKYWGEKEDRHKSCWGKKEGRLNSCAAPKIKYGYGVDEIDIADDGALIEDDEGWGMLTGPEFGCILWELPKKENKLLAEPDYDAGLLNDWDGGNVDWWHTYIRTEIERCNVYWRLRIEAD